MEEDSKDIGKHELQCNADPAGQRVLSKLYEDRFPGVVFLSVTPGPKSVQSEVADCCPEDREGKRQVQADLWPWDSVEDKLFRQIEHNKIDQYSEGADDPEF